MNLNKLKTVEKIMASNFPTTLLERLVALDTCIIRLEEVALEKEPDEDEQVVLVQDILQHAGAVITEFREVWAVYDDPDAEADMDTLYDEEAKKKEDNPIVDHPDQDDRRGGARESGKVEVDGEEENDEAVSNKDD